MKKLISYRQNVYAAYVPENAQERRDIVLVGGNHFDQVEFVGYENEAPVEPIYPHNTTQRHQFKGQKKKRSIHLCLPCNLNHC